MTAQYVGYVALSLVGWVGVLIIVAGWTENRSAARDERAACEAMRRNRYPRGVR